MLGYDPKFLGAQFEIPLPDFDAGLAGNLVRNDTLRDGVWGDYIHYSVALNKMLRAPVVACLNVNQAQLGKTSLAKGKKSWAKATSFGAEFQLGKEYYKDSGSAKNDYDKGHMAMRYNAAWGEDELAAIKASRDTYWYSNAVLQHKNLNRDEWQTLEEWVGGLQRDRDENLTTFSGPIWAKFNWSVMPEGSDPAIVPAAFFKIVCFVNKQDQLEVRAFMIVQHAAAIIEDGDSKVFDLEMYQVSVTEIEHRTGLRFDPSVSAANPIIYEVGEGSTNPLNVGSTPERIEVHGPEDMISHGMVRPPVADDEVDVFIAAAMVNPAGPERAAEWISLLNLKAETLVLDGWTLEDAKGRLHALSGTVGPGLAAVVQPVSPLQLANTGGSLMLRDANGARIDKVTWNAEKGAAEGKPIIFAYPGIY
jgi:endonuclease G